MSVEVESRNNTGFWRNRGLFSTRNRRRAVGQTASAAQQARSSQLSATPSAGAMFQDAQNTSIQNATFNIFTSGSAGGGNSTNAADIPRESPTRPGPSLESLTPQATRTPPTSPLLSEYSGYDSVIPDRVPPSDSELYRDRLQRKNLGHPLFIPGPNERLSEHYRQSGVMFGDVGVITSHGSFSYLFSIVHDATHPRNSGIRLPPDFVPFAASPNECEIEEFRQFDGVTGSYLADDSVTRVDSGDNPLQTVLQTSARQAAVLALPEPVHTASMLGLVPLRGYISRHLQSWYTFVRDVKGWDVKNGDIRVVHLSRKSSGYGIATVCNGTADPNTELVFSVHDPQPDRAESCRYRWRHKGCATVKAGPSTRPGAPQLVNQCLFIGTIDFKLGDEQWKAMEHGEAPLISCRKEQGSDLLEQSNHRFRGTYGTSSSDSATVYSASTSSGSRSLNSSWENLSITKQYSPEDKFSIPSDILADVLLRAVPSASFVSVCTQDWGPYYNDSVKHVSDFIDEVLAANVICEENGVVYLEPKPLSYITANEDTLPNAANVKVPDAFMCESNVETKVYEKVAICLQEVSTVISVLDRMRLDRCILTLRAIDASVQRIVGLKAEISELAKAVPDLLLQGSEFEPMENLDGLCQHLLEGLDSLVVDIQERAETYSKSSRLKAFLSVGADQTAHSCYRRRLDTLLLDFQMYQKGLIQNYPRKHQPEVSGIRLEGTTIWSDLPKGRQKNYSVTDQPSDKLVAYLHSEVLRPNRVQISWNIVPPTQKVSRRSRYTRKHLTEQLAHFQKVDLNNLLQAAGVMDDAFDYSRYLVLLEPRSYDEALYPLSQMCTTWTLRCHPHILLRDLLPYLSTPQSQPPSQSFCYSPILHNALLAPALSSFDERELGDLSNRLTYADGAEAFIEDEDYTLSGMLDRSQEDETIVFLYSGMGVPISQALSTGLLEDSDRTVDSSHSNLAIKFFRHGLALDERRTRFRVREPADIGCHRPSSPLVDTMLERCAGMPHAAAVHIAYNWLSMIDHLRWLISKRHKPPLGAAGQVDPRIENNEHEVSKSVVVWLDGLDELQSLPDNSVHAAVARSSGDLQNGIDFAEERTPRAQLNVAVKELEIVPENLADSGEASDARRAHCSKFTNC